MVFRTTSRGFQAQGYRHKLKTWQMLSWRTALCFTNHIILPTRPSDFEMVCFALHCCHRPARQRFTQLACMPTRWTAARQEFFIQHCCCQNEYIDELTAKCHSRSTKIIGERLLSPPRTIQAVNNRLDKLFHSKMRAPSNRRQRDTNITVWTTHVQQIKTVLISYCTSVGA